MTSPEVLCIGTICVDMFVRNITSWPRAGERAFTIMSPIYVAGGNALNVAFGLKKLGRDVGLIGMIGKGGHGQSLLSQIEAKGIPFPAHACQIDRDENGNKVSSSISFVLRDASAEPSFVCMAGANNYLNAELIDRLDHEGWFQECRYIHLTGLGLLPGTEAKDFADTIGRIKARHNQVEISMDVNLVVEGQEQVKTTKAWQQKLKHLLPLCDVMMPNNLEAGQITGTSWRDVGDEGVARSLHALGPTSVALKKGRDGCFLALWRNPRGNPEFHDFPAERVSQPADLTGAGDAWCAGFLSVLCEQKRRLADADVVSAARFANTVAAECIRKIGANTWTAPGSADKKRFRADDKGP